jgi:hypothetical protein
MTEIQNPKQKKQSLTRRKRLRCALNWFGFWSLRFGAWNFGFQKAHERLHSFYRFKYVLPKLFNSRFQ